MLIQFTEITKTTKPSELVGGSEAEVIKETPVMVNPEGIVSVNTSKLKAPGPHIIGVSKETDVSFIQLTTGRGIYVSESVEKVGEMVNAAQTKQAD